MKLGIIGYGNLGKGLHQSFLDKKHEFVISDNFENNQEVIKNSDIIFCCVDTKILPSNIFDIKNVMEVVEDFGVAFEEEIPLSEKILVICSTVNPGDTKEITDILSPFNLRVCYVPFIISTESITQSIQNQERIIIGSIEPSVIFTIGTLLNEIQKTAVPIVSMTTKSAEITKLLISSYTAYKINFVNMVGELLSNNNLVDEIKLVTDTLSGHKVIGKNNFDYGFSFGGPYLPSENRVLGEFCNKNKLEFILPYVTEDFNTQHNQFLKKYYININEYNEPFIVDGIGYKKNTTSTVESSKLNLVYDLLRDGHKVYIMESKEFIKESKLVKELHNDFGDNVKFYARGTSPKGIYISF